MRFVAGVGEYNIILIYYLYFLYDGDSYVYRKASNLVTIKYY